MIPASKKVPDTFFAGGRRVVLTGMGLVTPLGLDAPSNWAALAAGRSGVRRIREYDPSNLPVQFGGEVDQFDARSHLDKKDRKRVAPMPRTFHLAVVAAQFAMADAGNLKQAVDPARFGVTFGIAAIPDDLVELQEASLVSFDRAAHQVDLQKWGRDGISQIPPTWLLNHIPNMGACHISVMHDAQGPNNTITQTDIASLLALGESYRIVQGDRADVMLAGGADAKLVTVSMARQSMFSPLSRRNEAPEKACRPFDKHRDGRVLGEGASALVVEDLTHARRRGANIIAEICGFGAAFDRGCTGAGLARAVRLALRQARLEPDDLGHVNAHGYSTIADDIWEARGLREALGSPSAVPVFAPKSYIGNLGAGAGATELAFSLLAACHGTLPGTLNYDTPDVACPINVARSPRPLAGRTFLKVGCTERGQCAAIVCRAWDESTDTR
jgi:3-oxoacyl-[acyl-carrier-protein] synthase II